MLSQMVFIHITLLLLDPHDIHHEGKNLVKYIISCNSFPQVCITSMITFDE